MLEAASTNLSGRYESERIHKLLRQGVLTEHRLWRIIRIGDWYG